MDKRYKAWRDSLPVVDVDKHRYWSVQHGRNLTQFRWQCPRCKRLHEYNYIFIRLIDTVRCYKCDNEFKIKKEKSGGKDKDISETEKEKSTPKDQDPGKGN